MEDKEIVKALPFLAKCCKDEYNDIRVDKVLLGAFNLINRLQAENERLKGLQKDGFFNLLGNCLVFSKTLEDYNDMRKGLKAEAYKEFAERLKERKYLDETGWSHGEHPYIVEEDDIDDVLEELAGD